MSGRVRRGVVGALAVVGALTVVLVVTSLVWLTLSGPVPVGPSAPADSAPSAPPSTEGLVAQQLTADVVIPYQTAQQRAGGEAVLSYAGQGRIRVSAPVQFAGRELQAVAVGDVVVEGGDVVVRPSSIDLPGTGFLGDVVGRIAASAVTIRTPISGLPSHVHATKVTPVEDGLKVRVEGTQVPLPDQRR
ncbi:hypothetical protein KEM60_02427 [Austwickia sp. TVS 96-490-7B]|uniref:LmeA family phospholipid-binding protein n=1 Tax=Austwickia sp. TVS 96-490-7B TaxID=2830843 RepID=UPI001C576DCB|nr:LmeA family phospholipid-binding protein [Austwickia sp. TVS 96-490-7B]MBW3086216.1 hypothetical protein [Austwickia sp. TVS 96-490-7B]